MFVFCVRIVFCIHANHDAKQTSKQHMQSTWERKQKIQTRMYIPSAMNLLEPSIDLYRFQYTLVSLIYFAAFFSVFD